MSPPSTPGTSSDGPAAQSSGTPFDPQRWDEPVAPVASLITAEVTGDWTIHVSGAPGTFASGTRLFVAALGAGRGTLINAQPDGSFEAQVTGGEGDTVEVVQIQPTLPAGDFTLQVSKSQFVYPGVYVPVPSVTAVTAPEGARAVWDVGHTFAGLVWRFVGTVADEGDNVHVEGELRLRSDTDRPETFVSGRLTRHFDEHGEPLFSGGDFATHTLTPSGLPLSHVTRQPNPTENSLACEAVRESSQTLTCPIVLTLPAAGLPDGGYAVQLLVDSPATDQDESETDRLITGGRNYVPAEEGTLLALLDRGATQPFRLGALLLVDTPSQAARGVQAQGEAERWGWANQIAYQPPLHVTPRTDATGAEIRYVLEPYLPQMLLEDRDLPPPPLIAPLLPGGEWRVTIHGPDGSSTTLGPAPFKQIVTRTATSWDGLPSTDGGKSVDGVARLDTRNEAFRHAFGKDGLHRIEVEGSFSDEAGLSYRIAGTYPILVAEPLDLDLGMLPGTPLQVGQYVDRSIQVHPPVPAEITYRFREWTGTDAHLALDVTTTGEASRFGWFHPHAGHDPAVVPNAPGEYRVDVYANHTDAGGRLWAATWAFGGVVADPDDQILVHGRRGVDLEHQDLARFHRSETGIETGGNHLNFPYYDGDIAWQTDDDSMEVRVTVEDPEGAFSDLFISRSPGMWRMDPREADQEPTEYGPGEEVALRYQDGHGPLFSTTATGRDAMFGDPIDRWGYFYTAVEKPGVRVRELVREDLLPRGYWRFTGDTYTFQPGMGPEGDAPNDYKFLFTGAVVRAPRDGVYRVGAYGAFWIDLAEDAAGGSVTGSGFSPTALPLFRFGDRDVRAFYDPTGTRPGSLLVEGDVADFGGYLVPLGAQQLFLNVTSPSGKVRSLSGTSNAWGHLHEPSMNFVVDEPGVWRADVHLVACPPARDAAWPCLDGGLNDGETSYVFYVATKDAEPWEAATPAFLPDGGLDLRADGHGAGGHATAWMPAWNLEARAVGSDDALAQYHPQAFPEAFPNFDADRYGPHWPVEQVTFTAIAPDSDGSWRGFALDAWGTRLLPSQ